MSGAGITPMAFVPRRVGEVRLHEVALPERLRAALDALGAKRGRRLPVKRLEDDVRIWVDHAVYLGRGGDERDAWLMSLRPVDLGILCNVIAQWAIACATASDVGGPELRALLDLLEPEVFDGCQLERDVALFDDRGVPATPLAFPVFSLMVADAVTSCELPLANGEVMSFARVARGGRSGCSLLSGTRRFEGSPFAFSLDLHLETTPPARCAWLLADVGVSRFISEKWQDRPYLRRDVVALVRCGGGDYLPVPYGYSRSRRSLEWDEKARRHLDELFPGRLPELDTYLGDMDAWVDGRRGVQILSPHSTATTWARDSRVRSGVSTKDRPLFFDALARALDGIAEPCKPLAAARMSHLSPLLSASGDDASGEAARGERARLNRSRLRQAIQADAITFQLMGTAADDELLDGVERELVGFVGGAGEEGGLDVRIERRRIDSLCRPLSSSSDDFAQSRWKEVERELGPARGVTACVVALPGKEAFLRDGVDCDPKKAIRIGLARSGRLSQFIDSNKDLEGAEYRMRGAVRDLMRQLGFIPPFADVRGVDLSRPAAALWLSEPPEGRVAARFPLMVEMDYEGGLTSVECPLFAGRVPYRTALLEIARQSSRKDFQKRVSGFGGRQLKALVSSLARRGPKAPLLLVRAYGGIRCRGWWPGMSDAGIASDPLGVTLEGGTGRIVGEGDALTVLRVRAGADGEVPDHFTDTRDGSGDALADRAARQGIFEREGVLYALVGRPNMSPYTRSYTASKFDCPGLAFAQKELNEYFPLALAPGDDAVSAVRHAEALREHMVQFFSSGSRVNLPAPLHMATKASEYVWHWRRA